MLTAGIHHVTAITADAQANVDFYCGVLGLRLVKRTVNFDDPSSYHLYYGDGLGRPGTIVTFFVWPGGRRGRIGPPQVTATAFAVPAASIEFWSSRLQGHGVTVEAQAQRFGQSIIQFQDPDGLALELIGVDDAPGQPWADGPVPGEHAILGTHGVTIAEEGYEHTARVLTDLLGFRPAGEKANRFRYRTAGDGPGAAVDLLCVPDARRGGMGSGIIHHVAFRAGDGAEQSAARAAVVEANLNVSPVMDRKYFRSIYFREPGDVLFEIATDGPGFTVDEPPPELGTHLMLPDALESHRAEIERALPPIRLPSPT